MIFCGNPRAKWLFKMGYRSAIDDMQGNLIRNSRTEVVDGKTMLVVTEKTIKTICEEMKKES